MAPGVDAPDDAPVEGSVQRFWVDRAPGAAMDAAQTYLERAGRVAPRLRGRLERQGDALVVHHGRIRTAIRATPRDGRTHVVVERDGQAPLEETRLMLFGTGIAGFVLAWGLAWYNQGAERFLDPLVTITVFLVGLLAAIVGLYLVDRSLERRSRGLLSSLQSAMAGDPVAVLQRELAALARTTAVANAVLFYCVSLIVEFVVFAVLLSDGVRPAIDQALTVEMMQWGFGLPVAPALLFGVVWFGVTRRLHRQRLCDVVEVQGASGPSDAM